MDNSPLFDKLLISERRASRLEELAETIRKSATRNQSGIRESWLAAESILLRDSPSQSQNFTPYIVIFKVFDCAPNPVSGATITARVGSGPTVTIGTTDADGTFFYYVKTSELSLSNVIATGVYGQSAAVFPFLSYSTITYTMNLIPYAPYFCLCNRLMQPDTLTDNYGSTTFSISGGKWVATTTMPVGFQYTSTGGCSLKLVTSTVTLNWTIIPDPTTTSIIIKLDCINTTNLSELYPYISPLADSWVGCLPGGGSIPRTEVAFRADLSCIATPEVNLFTAPDYNVTPTFIEWMAPQQYSLDGHQLWETHSNFYSSGQTRKPISSGTGNSGDPLIYACSLYPFAKITFKDYP